MNAAGLHGDVRTMIHEAGHAFHSMLSERDPLVHYRHSPIEFAEVASMGMELLSMPRWREFYPDAGDLTRAWRDQLVGVVSILPWIATIDAFQLWIYEHPGHTRRERTDAWLSLMRRFGHDADWTGLERQLETLWHRQLHIFTVPMYYIEYGIAHSARQLWRIMSRRAWTQPSTVPRRARPRRQPPAPGAVRGRRRAPTSPRPPSSADGRRRGRTGETAQ